MKKPVLTIALLAGFTVALAGCSSAPKPRAELALSDSAFKSAELAGAREHAPIELRQAKAKLDAVNKAMRDEEFDRAKRYSEEALVDAKLAEAKAEAVKSEMALKEAKQGIQLMKDEVKRVKAPQ